MLGRPPRGIRTTRKRVLATDKETRKMSKYRPEGPTPMEKGREQTERTLPFNPHGDEKRTGS